MSQPGLVGSRVDRYAVEYLLGSGGFGSVYRARHVHTDVVVALKVLKRSMAGDAGLIERFLREAKAAAAVGSPHIVGVLDAGVASDGQAFLALEYLDGMDLKELAEREGPLPTARLVLVTLQVLDALDAAHARHIVHRDMKPANVFVLRRADERGVEVDYVKLLDFGISKMQGEGAAGSGLTMTGVAMGTPSYMAPEQFFDAKSVDGRADVYSVAVMLYELLSRRLPFDAESYAELIVKVRTEEPVPLQQLAPQVPTALAQTVMVGLAKDAMKRWQTARDFATALRTALSLPTGQPQLVVHTSPTPAPAPQLAPLSQYTPAAAKRPTLDQTSRRAPATAQPPPPAPVAPPAEPVAPVAAQVPVRVSVPPMKAPPNTSQRSTIKVVLIVVGVLGLLGFCCIASTVQQALEKARQETLRRANEP
jgi:serine/threonine-protein kinase